MTRGERQNMKQQYKYDAFISYRHSEPDSFVAQTLHKQLESFKLPRNVARRKIAQAGAAEHEDIAEGEIIDNAADEGKITDSAAGDGKSIDSAADVQEMQVNKTRIQRVFRDKEELPLVTNLADPITEALANSEFLIVICSPRLPESMWCRKEIETFIEMHDREHVLAVLVEGEPDTSFPEELLYREVEEIQPDGSVIKKRIPVEPLAADVRGSDRKEIRKKIKSEMLRLVAPMFNCNYDDLKQRHKEQRMRKIIMTSVSISAACLLFGVVSTTMALRIQHQNTQIMEQNTQIKEQNTQIQAQSNEIAAQAQEIEQQYREAKRNTAISRSKEAVNYFEEGDRLRAIATAQDALLDLSEGDGIEDGVDYPAEAIYALTDSLYLYENGQQILPDRILEADTAIRIMKLSPGGSRLLTVGNSGQIVVWQPDDVNAKVVFDVVYDRFSYSTENKIAFYGENGVFCPVNGGVSLYDVSDQTATETYHISCEDYVGIIVLHEQEQAVVLTEEGYSVIDCSDGSTVYEGQWDVDDLMPDSLSECVYSEDGKYWAVTLSSPFTSSEERKAVAVYSADTGEKLNVYPIEYEYVKSISFDDDRIYIVSNHSGETDITRIVQGMEGHLQAYDIFGGSMPLWTYGLQNGWLYDVACSLEEGSNYLLCSGYSDVVVLDKRDGSYVGLFSLGVEVVHLLGIDGSGSFTAFTRDGVWHFLNIERMEDMVGMLFPACTSTNVQDFAIGRGFCLSHPYNSRQVTIYRTASGEGLTMLHEGENNYAEAVLSADGSYLAAHYYDSSYTTAVEVIDTATGELLWKCEEDYLYTGMEFIDYNGQETLVIITSGQVLILDPGTGECLAEVTHEIGGYTEYLGYDRDGQKLLIKGNRVLYSLDLNRFAEGCYEIEHGGNLGYSDIVAADGSWALYAVADKEENILRFYRDGEEFYTYGQSKDISQPDYINFQYIDTMFFDMGQAVKHLYIVYADGRIVVLDINDDSGAAQFCTIQDSHADTEKYAGLDDRLKGYAYSEGDQYAILKGNNDAYLITVPEGDILAHLHGFLGYDSVGGKIYLTSYYDIYQIPLYTPEEINEIASDVRKTGQW